MHEPAIMKQRNLYLQLILFFFSYLQQLSRVWLYYKRLNKNCNKVIIKSRCSTNISKFIHFGVKFLFKYNGNASVNGNIFFFFIAWRTINIKNKWETGPNKETNRGRKFGYPTHIWILVDLDVFFTIKWI